MISVVVHCPVGDFTHTKDYSPENGASQKPIVRKHIKELILFLQKTYLTVILISIEKLHFL